MQPDNRGTLIISLDTELGWGCIENRLWHIREKNNVFKQVRYEINNLLVLFDRLKIHCTWGFVGKMIDSEPESSHSNLKIDIPDDIITAALHVGQKKTFWGSDIFDCVLNADMNHEIAWHSYHHIRFNSKKIDATYVEKDLKKSQEIADRHKIKIESMIFPQNIVGYLELLSRHGFTCYRAGFSEAFSTSLPKPISNLFKIIKTLFLSPPLSQTLTTIPNLIGMTGSMFFNPTPGRKKLLWLYKRRALRGIKKAIQQKGCFHLWFHPFNLVEIPDLYIALNSILKFAASQRDLDRLHICTMKDYRQLLKYCQMR